MHPTTLHYACRHFIFHLSTVVTEGQRHRRRKKKKCFILMAFSFMQKGIIGFSARCRLSLL